MDKCRSTQQLDIHLIAIACGYEVKPGATQVQYSNLPQIGCSCGGTCGEDLWRTLLW